MTKYGKYESDGLWSIQRKTWAMVDEMNGMDLVCERNKDGVEVR